jgi:putative hydrolase of the HAD superfamily
VSIAVVLFDLDDTLFAHRAAVDRGIVAHLAAIGGYSEADPTALWHELEERHYHRYLAGELDFEGQRRARAIDFAASRGLVLDDPSAWFDTYFEQYRAAWHLHDDTLPLLEALTQRTGIITNGDPAFQQRKLDQVGLSFEHVIASGALGFTKPDPRIFAHACALFGVAPADACYVGDRFETDALGAAAAGLLGVWIDRDGAATDAQLATAAEAGVRVIHSLAELPALL